MRPRQEVASFYLSLSRPLPLSDSFPCTLVTIIKKMSWELSAENSPSLEAASSPSLFFPARSLCLPCFGNEASRLSAPSVPELLQRQPLLHGASEAGWEQRESQL